MTAYYNEFDPFAAAWLRELIKAGHIADGVVDERSIVDVKPKDLTGFTQCHFFAGIGGWSRALRLASWPDSRPVWTGSPPCQPFSAAGLQLGKDDPRHLAPAWLKLVKSGKPLAVFGEQVAAAVKKDEWLDNVLNELEAEDYTAGAIVLPACGVGAPHLRQRAWIAAKRLGDSIVEPCKRITGGVLGEEAQEHSKGGEDGSVDKRPKYAGASVDGLADAAGRGQLVERGKVVPGEIRHADGGVDAPSRMVNSESSGRPGRNRAGAPKRQEESNASAAAGLPGPLYGSWGSADWLFCRDGKWRPVEPGTFPLANGVPNRVGKLRGYGNAIVPEVAAEVIGAAMEIFDAA